MTPAISRGLAGVGGNGTARQVPGGLAVSKRSYTPWWLLGGIPAANCIAAYQPKGAASYAASKVNLAIPGTYDAVEGVAPGWTAADGWIFANKRLETNITPPGAQTWSALCRFSNVSVGVSFLFGELEETTPSSFSISPNRSTGIVFQNHGRLDVSGGMASGVLGFSGRDCYCNGVFVGQTTTLTANGPRSIYIGTRHGDSYPLYGNIQCLAFYNTTLTAAQVLAVSTAIAAL